MLCPFCLGQQKAFETQRQKDSSEIRYLCTEEKCRQPVPAAYVKGYREFPPVVLSAVGFRAHGKSVYLASLFHVLYDQMFQWWPDFWARALNDPSQVHVQENRRELAAGRLPDSTPQNFPIPTIVRINGVPGRRNSTLLLYDTAGENFERERQLIEYASFVQRSRTMLFLVDVSELENPGTRMHDLLETYLNGMDALQADTHRQHLVVVFTKGDALLERFSGKWRDVGDYLRDGDPSALSAWRRYTKRMQRLSRRLEGFAKYELHADLFARLAQSSFISVSYCIVSALGAEPDRENNRLAVGATPKRVIDPLLWITGPSHRGWS